jgi:hypothetical protein
MDRAKGHRLRGKGGSVTDIRFWRDGARTMGPCAEHNCGGVMMLLEDEGAWYWCQCAACLKQAGIGKPSQLAEKRLVVREPGTWSF